MNRAPCRALLAPAEGAARLAALNKPEAFILAIVQISNCFASEPRYVREPFKREPDFGATAVTYKLSELLELRTAS